MRGLKDRFIDHLNQIAFFLEIREENVFKIRAFKGGEEILDGLTAEDFEERIKTDTLTELKGIGKGIASCAKEFAETETSAEWAKSRGNLPVSLFELRDVSGLGPKKIKKIYDSLGISTLGELEYACNENRLVGLAGFGEKTQRKIVEEIQLMKGRRGKYLLSDAYRIAEDIEMKIPKNVSFERLGDLGAKRPIVENFKYLVVYHSQKPSLQLVGQKTQSSRVDQAVKNKEIQFKTKEGFQCTFLFRKPNERIVRTIFETSTSDHWESLLKRAQKKGFELSNDELKHPKRELKIDSDSEFYSALDLPLHTAEQREFSASEKLEKPLHEDDLQGVFHAHTVDSDGTHTLQQMAEAAQKWGWKYLGISDHSKSASYANGLDEARIKSQGKEIDDLNSKAKDFKIFKGIEADILKDGALDYTDKVLADFDFVIASIHQRFGLKEMTDRLISAIENPFTTMIGHISGRLLLSREPYAFDRKKVLRAAIKNGVIVEFNAHPHRLDLDWQDLAWACQEGLLVSINPDAHSIEGYQDIAYGIALCRKALVPRAQIFNTWPIEKVEQHFKKRRSS